MLLETMDEVSSIYFCGFSLSESGNLLLTLEEARVGSPVDRRTIKDENNEVLKKMLQGSRKIETVAGCKRFALEWESHVAYSVIDETYARREAQEFGGSGRLVVLHTNSGFLEYLKVNTIAFSIWPDRIRQWTFYCLDECVTVVSVVDPTLKVSIV